MYDASAMRTFHLYILGNDSATTLYVGVTSDLIQRIYQHRSKQVGGFTRRYGLTKLLYFEKHATAESAITREKQMKKWKRIYKERLIDKMNPERRDLWEDII